MHGSASRRARGRRSRSTPTCGDRCPTTRYVVAADSGLHHAGRARPARRSASSATSTPPTPRRSTPRSRAGATIERHPAEKDATDLELAIDVVARASGVERVVVVGGARRPARPLPRQRALLASPALRRRCEIEARFGDARRRGACTAAGPPVELDGAPGGLVTLLPAGGARRGVAPGPRVPAARRRPGAGHHPRRQQRHRRRPRCRSRSTTARCSSCNRSGARHEARAILLARAASSRCASACSSDGGDRRRRRPAPSRC